MLKLANKLYFKGMKVKDNVVNCLKSERGDTNIIAIILILAIVIALAIIFKNQLTTLFNKIWGSLFTEVDKVV